MKITKFLRIIFAIQLTIIGLIGSASFGFDIPFLRQIVGFVYVTFVPGILLLRIFKLHKLGTIETLLYSVGLSIAFVMFTGLFMNLLYPLIGISRPISIIPIIVTLTFAVMILCVIAYKRKDHEEEPISQPNSICWSELFSPPTLFLLLLPLVAALGTFLVYFHLGNIVSLIFLSLVVVVVILITLDKFIPAKLYPLAVVAIGLGLLWQWSLVSLDLHGFDVHTEYYIQNLVFTNSVWNHIAPGNVTAMLSVVMLQPIYSLMLNIDTIWVLKIVYPALFSLAPLALFQAYRKQTDDKIAFLGTFFFMSWLTFFAVMIDLPRQQIAELFLALSILLLVDKEIARIKRATLLIIFGFSIVVSHYGLSYIYMLYLLLALSLLFLFRNRIGQEQRTSARVCKSGHNVDVFCQPPESAIRGTLNTTYVLLFIVFCVSWYMYVSAGAPFASVAKIGDHIYSSFISEIFSPESREPAILTTIGLSREAVGIELKILRTLHHITHFLIMVGVIELLINLRKTKLNPEYVAMTIVSIAILAASVIIPNFANAININRIYHITLFFLAPFCIFGGKIILRWLFRAFSLLLHHNLFTSSSLTVVVILVLVPYFLFNTGFVYEFTGSTSRVITLSLYEKDHNFFTKPEIDARKWLANMGRKGFTVYCDVYGCLPLMQIGSIRSSFPSNTSQIRQNSYIFLRRWNIVHGEMLLFIQVTGKVSFEYINLDDETAFSNALRDRNKIYDGGGAQILGSR